LIAIGVAFEFDAEANRKAVVESRPAIEMDFLVRPLSNCVSLPEVTPGTPFTVVEPTSSWLVNEMYSPRKPPIVICIGVTLVWAAAVSAMANMPAAASAVVSSRCFFI
jgi:hypothetical protein